MDSCFILPYFGWRSLRAVCLILWDLVTLLDSELSRIFLMAAGWFLGVKEFCLGNEFENAHEL